MTEYGNPRGRPTHADDPAWPDGGRRSGRDGYAQSDARGHGGRSQAPAGGYRAKDTYWPDGGEANGRSGGGVYGGQGGSWGSDGGGSRDGRGSRDGGGSRSGGSRGGGQSAGSRGGDQGGGSRGDLGPGGGAPGQRGSGGRGREGSGSSRVSGSSQGRDGGRTYGSGGGSTYGAAGTYGAARDGSGGRGSGAASGGVYGAASARPAGGAPAGPGTGRPSTGTPGTGKPGAGKKGKRRSPVWTKLSIALGSLVMVAAVLGMVALNLFTGAVDNAVTQEALINHGTQPVDIKGAINLLMVGLDTRDNNPGMGSRSDSIIIAHIPATHDQVDLISIPRDTYVPIPAFPKTRYRGGSSKINAAFQFGSSNGGGDAGGMQLLQNTISENYHIQFQGALIVNFDGFTDIVTKLGGVTMYVDEKTISLHHGYLLSNPKVHAAPFKINPDGTPGKAIPGTAPVIYQKGTQHLSAYAALDYVRCRDFLPNADYDRQRHQQQFIKALMEEAYQKGINDPTQISDFLKSLSKAFIWDGGGRALSDWIFTLKGISPSAIRTLKINDGTYNTVMVGKMSTQQMSATSMQLLADVNTDTVENFIAEHPDWVSQS